MQGIITPERLAEMKPEEMASKELTKLREKVKIKFFATQVNIT